MLCSIGAKAQYLTSGTFAADGSSVIDVGSVLYAFNLDDSGQGSPDLNGVTFEDINSLTTTSPDFSISNSGGFDSTPAGTPTTAAIYPLVARGAYNNLTLTLDDLTPGQTYAAQLVIGEQTGDNRSQVYTDGFSSSPTVYPINGPQYILDTFTATGTSETLVAHVGGGGGAQLTGFVVEDAPAPSNLYYDTNGVTAGTNTTGSSNFTDSDWTTDPTGSSATSGFVGGSNVTFSAGTNGTGAQNVTVTDSEYVNSLTFNNGTVTLLGSGSAALDIGNGGITNNSTDGPTTFDSSLGTVQATANEQWDNDSSQALNINSGVTSAGATITFDGTGSGAVNLNGQLSGNLNLTAESPTSTVYLNSENNSFTGTITVNGGGLVYQNQGSLNNNNITLENGGVLESANEVFSTGNDDLSNNITLGVGGGEVSGGVVGSYGNDTIFSGTFTGGTGLSVVNGDFITQNDGTSNVGTLNVTGPSRLLVGSGGIFGNNAVVNVSSILDFGWNGYAGTLNNTINLENGGAIENRGPGFTLTDVVFPTGTATVTLGADDVGGGSITVGGPGINLANGTTLTIVSNAADHFTEYNNDPNAIGWGQNATFVNVAENISGSGNLILTPETANIYYVNTNQVAGTRLGLGSPIELTGNNSNFTGTTTIGGLTVYAGNENFGSSTVTMNSYGYPGSPNPAVTTLELTGGTLSNHFIAGTGYVFVNMANNNNQAISGPLDLSANGTQVFVTNRGTGNLTFGNITYDGAGNDYMAFDASNGGGSITLNGTYTTPVGSGETMAFGGDDYYGSEANANYYLGPNADFTNFQLNNAYGSATISLLAGNLYIDTSAFDPSEFIAVVNNAGDNHSIDIVGSQNISAYLYTQEKYGPALIGQWTMAQTTADASVWSGYINQNSTSLIASAVAGGRLTFTNDIGGAAPAGVIKTGAGVVVFADPNGNDFGIYNGDSTTPSYGTTAPFAVDIQQGTLLINNQQGYGLGNNNGSVNIEKGATFGGSGSIDPYQTVIAEDPTSVISPGDAGQANLGIKATIGTLTLAGVPPGATAGQYALEANNGLIMDFKLSGDGVYTDNTGTYTVAGVSNDFLTIGNGGMTLSGPITINLSALGDTPIATGVYYTLIQDYGNWDGDPTSITINAPVGYELDPTFGPDDGLGDGKDLGYIWDTTPDGGGLYVQLIATPEPSTYGLLGLGLLALVALNRSRFVRKSCL